MSQFISNVRMVIINAASNLRIIQLLDERPVREELDLKARLIVGAP